MPPVCTDTKWVALYEVIAGSVVEGVTQYSLVTITFDEEMAPLRRPESFKFFWQPTKKNKNNRRISAERAEKRIIPQNGWEEFEQYIKDSTKITTADSVFTGEEYLSFTIGDDGLPESIKILRSVSPSHDREAIRLLQNGPAWKVTKGKSREIRLKIIFWFSIDLLGIYT